MAGVEKCERSGNIVVVVAIITYVIAYGIGTIDLSARVIEAG